MILTKTEKEILTIVGLQASAAIELGEHLSENDIRRCVSAADLDKLVALTDENEELLKKQRDLDQRGEEQVMKMLKDLKRFFQGRN